MKKLFIFLFVLAISQSAIADNIVCDTNVANYFAIYNENTHVCESGYYMPANTDGCKPCPDGLRCQGGTFKFNPNYFQGIDLLTISGSSMNNVCAVNFPTAILAIYTPNIHECSQGHYMPANTDGCVICPENNFCPGGTYTFNETITQGISVCPENAPFAPVGMWSESQCGRKLHIDGDVLYMHREPVTPTEHQLYVRVKDDIYSANMTIVPTFMNRDSTRFLKILYNSTEYYVCDDTSYKTDNGD